MNKEIAEKIYEVLTRQKFWDWYADERGDFTKHITSDDNCKTKDEILEDIQKIFGKIV